MSSQQRLARNLRKIRMQKGLSQEKVAELAGIHRTYVGLIERSQRNINLATVDKLATALNVDIVELLQQ